MSTSRTDAAGIVLPVELDTTPADAELHAFEARARASTRKVGADADRMGFSFEDAMRKWRKEEKAESRYTRFLAGQLSDLGLAAGETGQVFGKLAVVLSGGFGVMAAVEIVKWGIEAFVASSRKAKEQAEAFATNAEQMAGRLRNAFRDFTLSQANTNLSERTTRILQALSPLRDELVKVNDSIKEIERASAKLNRNSGDYQDKMIDLINLRAERQRLINLLPVELARAEQIVDEAMARESDYKLGQEFTQKQLQLFEQGRDKLKAIRRENALSALDERDKVKAALDFELADLRQFAEHYPELAAEARRKAALALAAVENRRGQASLADEEKRIAEEQARGRVYAELKARAEALRDAHGNPALASALATAHKEEEDAIREQILMRQHGITTEIEFEEARTRITAEGARKRAEILRRENAVELAIAAAGSRAYDILAQHVTAAWGRMTSHSLAYDRAMRASGRATAESAGERSAAYAKMAQDVLSSISTMAVGEMTKEIALALSTQGLTWGVPNGASVNHWASAAVWAGIAGTSGLGAYAIGEGRGLTRDEKAGIYGPGGAGPAGSEPSTARDLGAAGGSAGSGVVRETVIVIGDPFETPAETARRAARRLAEAKRLDMLRR